MERFSDDTRYLATSNRPESELEKPYNQLEYEAMHNDPIEGWDGDLINPPPFSDDPDLPPIPDLPNPWVPPDPVELNPIPDLPPPWTPPEGGLIDGDPPGYADGLLLPVIECVAAPLCALTSVCLGYLGGVIAEVRVIADEGLLVESSWFLEDDILTVEFLVDASVANHVVTVEVEDTEGNIASGTVELDCSSEGGVLPEAVWVFDETSGDTILDGSGTITITFLGIEDGDWGVVDGKAAITITPNEYGVIPASIQNYFGSSFSLTCWFNFSAGSGYLFGSGGPGISHGKIQLAIVTGGYLAFSHNPGNGDNTNFNLYKAATYSGPTGWVHVAVTVDETDGPKMYVGGAQLTGGDILANMGIDGSFVYTYAELISGWSSYPLSDYYSSEVIALGASWDWYLGYPGSATYFEGSIHSIGIYDKALSAAEVSALYSA